MSYALRRRGAKFIIADTPANEQYTRKTWPRRFHFRNLAVIF